MKFEKFVIKMAAVFKYFSIICVGMSVAMIVEFGFEMDFVLIFGLSAMLLGGALAMLKH